MKDSTVQYMQRKWISEVSVDVKFVRPERLKLSSEWLWSPKCTQVFYREVEFLLLLVKSRVRDKYIFLNAI